MDDLVVTTCWKTIGKQVLLVSDVNDWSIHSWLLNGMVQGMFHGPFSWFGPRLDNAKPLCLRVGYWKEVHLQTARVHHYCILLLNGHVKGIHQFQTKPFVVSFGCLSCDVLTWLWKINMCWQSWKFSWSLHLSFSIKTNAPRTHIACVPATFWVSA